MPIIVTLWWLFFWTATGLCVGSFLNVVIYRLPRDRSLRDPLWSACPACAHRIRWYDNLPIVSYALLRGRCRDCHAPISPRYVFIEAATAIVVLLLLDAFFVGHVRTGLEANEFGLTDQLAADWPIFVSHLVLFSALLAMSAIDMEHYWVDVRFTNLATACGFLFHLIWTPKHSAAWFRPGDTPAVMSLVAMVGLFVVWLWLITRKPAPVPEGDPDQALAPTEVEPDGDTADAVEPDGSGDRPPSGRSGVFAWTAVAVLIILFGTLFMTGIERSTLSFPIRTGLPLALFFLVIVRESTVSRESDREIIEAIDDERDQARGMVLREFVTFLPVILFALAGFWLMREESGVRERIAETLHSSFPIRDVGLFRRWAPLEGLSTAALGYLVAGGLGWTVRIVFTLVFGREAFATGDIHMMAAAGCIAGWPVVVLGFFLTSGIALAGWLLTLPFKRVRALPLGPWLFLALLITTIFYEPLVNCSVISRAITVINALVLGNPS